MCFKLKLAREDAATQKLHYNSKSRIGCPCGAYSVPTVDPDSHGVCHGDELIYLFEPFYSHNGDPGLGPLSGDDLGQTFTLFSSSQNFKTPKF